MNWKICRHYSWLNSAGRFITEIGKNREACFSSRLTCILWDLKQTFPSEWQHNIINISPLQQLIRSAVCQPSVIRRRGRKIFFVINYDKARESCYVSLLSLLNIAGESFVTFSTLVVIFLLFYYLHLSLSSNLHPAKSSQLCFLRLKTVLQISTWEALQRRTQS